MPVNTVIDTAELSKTILFLIRDGLRTAASGAAPLTDPNAAKRSAAGGAPFIMTSFPSKRTYYPHVIVEESVDTGSRIDRRQSIHEHRFGVNLDIVAESSTHVKVIRDQVRHWFEDNIAALQDAGWHDVDFTGSVSPSWDTGSSIHSIRLSIEGTLYSSST